MKTLYITRGNNILVDTENNTANRIDTARQGIDNMYVAKEPMHVVYGVGEYHRETDVDANDIIVTFYPSEFKNKMLIIKNPEWVENILDYEAKQQEEKIRWAEAKTNNEAEKAA